MTRHWFMKWHLYLLLMIGSTISACSTESSEPTAAGMANPVEPITVNQPFLLTQERLDTIVGIVSVTDSAITGNSFGVRTDSTARFFKTIHTNKPLNRSIQTGDVFSIRSFQNENGRRGSLVFIDLMVRRETGFNPGAGDFEFFRMDFDSATNYRQHPNGLVPTLANTRDRGLDVARAGCVACHRLAAGGNFLFTTR